MNFYKVTLYNLIIFIFFTSCNSETSILTDYQLGYHYYPMSLGKSWIYRTDSILYQKSNGQRRDSFRCFIKETAADTFTDPDGNLVYNVEIFYRKRDTLPWELIDNTFITVGSTNIIRNDFGFDFIKLVFPVIKNKSWNGNIRIDQQTEIKLNGEFFRPFNLWNGRTYFYTDILNNQTIGNLFYKKVVNVEEIDFKDDINRIYSTATYAEDVGLVYREFWLLSSDNPDINLPWEEKADYGAIIKQTLIQ
ncbi:MAG: hypothetical protein ABIO44_06120 [Saprospiraceae bacterium]